MIDPENAIVQLCVEGMKREDEGSHDVASDLFQQAWNRSTDSLERSIAAHYVARHQKCAEATLHWNQEAMTQANAAEEDSVRMFYPSLYLNLGKSYESIGKPSDAKHFYECAQRCMDDLPEGAYRCILMRGVEDGLLRVGGE